MSEIILTGRKRPPPHNKKQNKKQTKTKKKKKKKTAWFTCGHPLHMRTTSFTNDTLHTWPSRSHFHIPCSVVECRTPEREVGGSIPTAAVLCPGARHFTPRKYWLITQEAVAPSRHDWKIVDWDVKPQHKQTKNPHPVHTTSWPPHSHVTTPWISHLYIRGQVVMVLRKCLDQYLSTCHRWTKSIKGFADMR